MIKSFSSLTKIGSNNIFWFSLNLFTIIALLYLPYYLFDGRLFLGGDDTRLYYVYPNELLREIAFFSWTNISSLPLFLPNHHAVPLLIVFSFLEHIIQSKAQLFYLAFSLPLILGFIYFQKFINRLIDKNLSVSYAAALIYILCPITIVSQLSYFLTPVWLIALFPIMAYYYTGYIKSRKSLDILKAVVWSIIFSIVYYATPWIFGLILPLFCGFIFLVIFFSHPWKKIVKRSLVFWYFIISSQLFWLIPFIISLIYKGEADLLGKVVSKDLTGSFAPTVLSTATGNIIYPLLTHYHRQIAIDYDWQLKNVFLNYFDSILPLSLIFIVVLLLGIYKYRSVLAEREKKIFIYFFVSFLLALYLFTVNIGFLKNLFLLLGYIPGFAVFRNFTDKFALAYVFIYVSFLATCLSVIKKSFKFYSVLLFAVLFVVLINFLSVKQIVNSPLWTTDSMYRTVSLPTEYMSFANKVRSDVPNTANILALPQNIAAYSIITENNGKNSYIGTSPFRFFSGINDLTGSGSYPKNIAESIRESVIARDYANLLEILAKLNVRYVIVTNNVPQELKRSFLFDDEYLVFQDEKLINAIKDEEIIRSDKGNYILYSLKNSPRVISSDIEVEYKKINPVKYEIAIKNLKDMQKINFLETYHPGWKLYSPNKHFDNTIADYSLDVLYLFKKSFFDNTHKRIYPYGNEWSINPEELKNNSRDTLYKINKDGSVDIKLILYFFPQSYFYIGIFMTILFLLLGFVLLFKIKKNKINEKNG